MKKAVSYFKAMFSPIRCCFFFVLVLTPFFSFSQTRGRVEVVKDSLIDTLIAKRSGLLKTNTTTPIAEPEYGYRVQIFLGSNRQAAYSAQAKFNNEYPEFRTYITYTEPNFRVQAGDFRTRLEAEKLKNELARSFTSLFIISGKINPPKTDTSND